MSWSIAYEATLFHGVFQCRPIIRRVEGMRTSNSRIFSFSPASFSFNGTTGRGKEGTCWIKKWILKYQLERIMDLARDLAYLNRNNQYPVPIYLIRVFRHLYLGCQITTPLSPAGEPFFLPLQQAQYVNMEQTSTDLPTEPPSAKRRRPAPGGCRNCNNQFYPFDCLRLGHFSKPRFGYIQGTSPA